MNSINIFEKLKSGKKIDKEELIYLNNEILNPTNIDDLYTIILAFGLVNHSDDSIAKIEKYLSFDYDDIIISAVIKVISQSNYWNLGNKYIDQLLPFLNKEKKWEYLECQIASSNCIGFYLHDSKDKVVFRKIYLLFTQEFDLMSKINAEYEHKDWLYDIILSILDIGIRGKESILDLATGRRIFSKEKIDHILMEIQKKYL